MHVVRRRLGTGLVASLTLIAMSFALLIPTAFAARPKCFGRTATQVGSEDGEDTCFGGESALNCEATDPPEPNRSSSGKVAFLARY